MTTASGLRIACLGGVYDPEIYTSADTPLVCKATITTHFQARSRRYVGFYLSLLFVPYQRKVA